MLLHLYDHVIKCHDTRAKLSEMPSMSWYYEDNILGNVFNVHVNLSTDTKLCTCKICTHNINFFSGTRHIVRDRRASVVHL